MKRFIAIITVALFTSSVTFAQNVEINQKSYLPKKGDWAFGVDLKPILEYVGSIFNDNADVTVDYLGGEPVSNSLDGWSKSVTPKASIMGKYMLDDNWALRANVGLLFGSNSTRSYVQDDKSAVLEPLDKTKLIDSQKSRKNGMSIMFGTEYRKGTKRIQGVFGAGALIGFQSVATIYNYANKITSINQHPSTSLQAPPSVASGYRVTKQKGSSDVFYGITGSAGIEWFVAPKVALGAEVNLSMYGISGGQQYTESEGWNSVKQEVDTRYDLSSPGNTVFRFGTDNIGGSLYMSFYF